MMPSSLLTTAMTGAQVYSESCPSQLLLFWLPWKGGSHALCSFNGKRKCHFFFKKKKKGKPSLSICDLMCVQPGLAIPGVTNCIKKKHFKFLRVGLRGKSLLPWLVQGLHSVQPQDHKEAKQTGTTEHPGLRTCKACPVSVNAVASSEGTAR